MVSDFIVPVFMGSKSNDGHGVGRNREKAMVMVSAIYPIFVRESHHANPIIGVSTDTVF